MACVVPLVAGGMNRCLILRTKMFKATMVHAPPNTLGAYCHRVIDILTACVSFQPSRSNSIQPASFVRGFFVRTANRSLGVINWAKSIEKLIHINRLGRIKGSLSNDVVDRPFQTLLPGLRPPVNYANKLPKLVVENGTKSPAEPKFQMDITNWSLPPLLCPDRP